MHSSRVGGSPSTLLTGMVVDKIMKIGGWRTESIAKYYIGATSSERVQGSKRKCGHSFAGVSELPLSPRVREMMEAIFGETTTGPVVNYKYNSTAQRSKGRTTGRRRRRHPIQYLQSIETECNGKMTIKLDGSKFGTNMGTTDLIENLSGFVSRRGCFFSLPKPREQSWSRNS